MFSYIQIMNRQNELQTKREKLHIDRINLVAPLYNLRIQYPEIFNILPNDFNSKDPHKFDTRLRFLIDEVEDSYLEDSTKTNIIELINDIRKKLEVINNKQRMYDRFLIESVGPEKLKRENYLEDIDNRLEQINKGIEILENEIESYEKEIQLGIEKNYDELVLNSFREVISRKEQEKKELKNQKTEIYKEPGITEELELYKAEKDKIEKQQLEILQEEQKKSFEERKRNQAKKLATKTMDQNIGQSISESQKNINIENDITKEIELEDAENANDEEMKNDVDFVLVDNENDDNLEENKEENKEETSLAMTPEEESPTKTNEEKIEPIKPEKPKKVKEKHKASLELISKIKKYGAVTLGVAAIGIAITTLIMNPAIAGWALASGLILSETKESLIKK